MDGGEIVPELLQPDRALWISISPQQVDHLAESADAPGGALDQRAVENPAHDALEPVPVRHPAVHERRQGLAGVEDAQVPGSAGGLDVDAGRGEARAERSAVRLVGDQDRWLSFPQARGEKRGHLVREEVLAFVELDAMVVPL